MTRGQCRFCGATLERTFVDLGASPIANDYLDPSQSGQMEPFYPLHVKICGDCLLVQVADCISARHIFSDHYAYFSSFSDSWLAHARAYVDMITARLALGKQHRVIEVACNDGYLLQYFVARGIPVLGIEPTANTAAAAAQKGIPTVVQFLGEETARKLAGGGQQADLLIGNNVLAHVPQINDFVEGLRILLKPTGVLTMEFPHLMRLISDNQFDTIYHEHYQYLSLMVVEKIFAAHGLTVFDVEELPTHGGSLRIYAKHVPNESRTITPRVQELRQHERDAGLDHLDTYVSFTERVKETKRQLLEFLIAAKRGGKTVVAYGAPAKGNTLLNYCGVRTDFIDYTVDRSPHKQHLLLPGTRIPIHHPDRIRETKPDYVLILPWNIKEEIMDQMAYIREWGGQFVVPIPEVRVSPGDGCSIKVSKGDKVMITLIPNPLPQRPLTVLCLGAHADDIEIGCGGTLLKLTEQHPNVTVHWVVFSATPPRAREAQHSARVLLRSAHARKVVIKKFRDSYFPFMGERIKTFMQQLGRELSPDLVFTHHRKDLHQDHRLLAELTWNAFRNHLILEYEIPKYDGDLGAPNAYVHLSRDVAERKVRHICEEFKTQKARPWFSEDTFLALLRLRGIESNSPGKYAEAFYCQKLLLL